MKYYLWVSTGFDRCFFGGHFNESMALEALNEVFYVQSLLIKTVSLNERPGLVNGLSVHSYNGLLGQFGFLYRAGLSVERKERMPRNQPQPTNKLVLTLFLFHSLYLCLVN